MYLINCYSSNDVWAAQWSIKSTRFFEARIGLVYMPWFEFEGRYFSAVRVDAHWT